MGARSGAAAAEDNLAAPQNAKHRVTQRCTAGRGAKRHGNRCPCENAYANFHSSLIHKIGKKRKRPKCPSNDEWVNKRGVRSVENYSATKRGEAVGVARRAERQRRVTKGPYLWVGLYQTHRTGKAMGTEGSGCQGLGEGTVEWPFKCYVT